MKREKEKCNLGLSFDYSRFRCVIFYCMFTTSGEKFQVLLIVCFAGRGLYLTLTINSACYPSPGSQVDSIHDVDLRSLN